MITKEEAVEHLRKLGYDAAEVDGMVHVTVEKPLTQKERNKLEKSILKLGYSSSWGWGVPRKRD